MKLVSQIEVLHSVEKHLNTFPHPNSFLGELHELARYVVQTNLGLLSPDARIGDKEIKMINVLAPLVSLARYSKPEVEEYVARDLTNVSMSLAIRTKALKAIRDPAIPNYIISPAVASFWRQQTHPEKVGAEQLLAHIDPMVLVLHDGVLCVLPDMRPAATALTYFFLSSDGRYERMSTKWTRSEARYKSTLNNMEAAEWLSANLRNYVHLRRPVTHMVQLTDEPRPATWSTLQEYLDGLPNAVETDSKKPMLEHISIILGVSTFMRQPTLKVTVREGNKDRAAAEEALRRKAEKTGKPVREPNEISIKYVDIEETMLTYINEYNEKRKDKLKEEPGYEVRPHVRRSHWHHYWIGTGDNRKRVPKWIPDINVKGGINKEQFLCFLKGGQ